MQGIMSPAFCFYAGYDPVGVSTTNRETKRRWTPLGVLVFVARGFSTPGNMRIWISGIFDRRFESTYRCRIRFIVIPGLPPRKHTRRATGRPTLTNETVNVKIASRSGSYTILLPPISVPGEYPLLPAFLYPAQ